MHKVSFLLFMDERLSLRKPTAAVSSAPIHIFIGLSNIIIGFCDCLPITRGISIQKRIKAPAFSFDSLHALLTRGRGVGKKVVTGSLSSKEA